MRNFRIRDAKCHCCTEGHTEDCSNPYCDREIINLCIRKWFGTELCFREVGRYRCVCRLGQSTRRFILLLPVALDGLGSVSLGAYGPGGGPIACRRHGGRGCNRHCHLDFLVPGLPFHRTSRDHPGMQGSAPTAATVGKRACDLCSCSLLAFRSQGPFLPCSMASRWTC